MIEGIEEYLAKLTSMAEIEDEMFQSVDQCGEFVRDDARLRVPVDTGDLRKSIDHTTRKENGDIVSDKGIRYIAGQPAQPYLYPAIRDNEDQIIDKLNADALKAIEEKVK